MRQEDGDSLCLVVTGDKPGAVHPDSRVHDGHVVLSAVGFKPEASSLTESVVDFEDGVKVTERGLTFVHDCTGYRLVVWLAALAQAA